MRLIYQGTDITDSVDIISAVHRDVSDRRCDGLELTLDHAAAWYGWGPQTDDTILLTENGYSTGTLYLETASASLRRQERAARGAKRGQATRTKRLRTSSSNARQRAAWRADYTALKES